MNEYDKQANDFLKRNNLQFKAVLKDEKSPPWSKQPMHGRHYVVTLSGSTPFGNKRKISFDFWGSIKDREDGVIELRAYDVLACISSDVYYPETFNEFCEDYGYSPDSISAIPTFRRCITLGKKLRKFFSEKEIEELQDIR